MALTNFYVTYLGRGASKESKVKSGWAVIHSTGKIIDSGLPSRKIAHRHQNLFIIYGKNWSTIK